MKKLTQKARQKFVRQKSPKEGATEFLLYWPSAAGHGPGLKSALNSQ